MKSFRARFAPLILSVLSDFDRLHRTGGSTILLEQPGERAHTPLARL